MHVSSEFSYLLSTKDLTGSASIGCVSDATVAKYARFAVAINLQKIAQLLEQSWKFSIALNMSTHMSTSYLDIRLHLHLLKYGILNVHFLAISLYERRIDEVIFSTTCEVLDAMLPQWCDIIIAPLQMAKKNDRPIQRLCHQVPKCFKARFYSSLVWRAPAGHRITRLVRPFRG